MNERRIALRELKELERQVPPLGLGADDWPEPWQNLIATLLSARTRDETTIPVASSLFRHYPSLESLAQADLEALEGILRPVNYSKTKARHVQECARVLWRD